VLYQVHPPGVRAAGAVPGQSGLGVDRAVRLGGDEVEPADVGRGDEDPLAAPGRAEPVRVTRISNEPEADPILHGTFIGDYFQIDAKAGRVCIHYDANLRHVPLVGQGVPIPQQDNYLTVRGE